MLHFTYSILEEKSDLEQGDIILPTEELKRELSKDHHNYCDDKYLGYAIATQSCDLVRRNGKIKADYISIAVIRSLKDVLPRLLAKVIKEINPGVFLQSDKEKAKQFLQRLFNQNEQALGLFYLHDDADVGVLESSVVFLRIKVALHVKYYDILLEARKGRLSPEFRAKFGWLIGNLYSRPASPDWSDMFPDGKSVVNGMIKDQLEEKLKNAGPIWIEDEDFEAAKKGKVPIKGSSHEELLKNLKLYSPKSKLDRLVNVIIKEAKKALYPPDRSEQYDDQIFDKLKNRLLNNSEIRKIVKN